MPNFIYNYKNKDHHKVTMKSYKMRLGRFQLIRYNKYIKFYIIKRFKERVSDEKLTRLLNAFALVYEDEDSNFSYVQV